MTYPEGLWEQQVKAGFAALVGYAGVEAVFIAPDGTEYRPRVLYTEPSEQILAGMQLSDEYSIEYDPAALPGLRHGSAITIKGDPYIVRNPAKTADGFTFLAKLTKG